MNDYKFLTKATKEYHLKKIRNLIKDVLPYNKFYKEKLANVGIHSYKDIKTWDDFLKIPFTTKQELRENQNQFPSYGSNTSRPINDYTFLTFTSGTSSSRRFNTIYTVKDYEKAVEQELIWLRLMNVTPKDRVIYILPYVLFTFLSKATMKLGALLIPADSKSQLDLLNNLLQVKPTVMETSPTVILNLMRLALEENINLKKIGLQKIILTGEPGVNDIRKKVEKAFDCDCFDALGSTELLIYAFDCKDKKGPHLIEENTIFEILNPKTGKVSETGEGELVGTTLWRHDFPFIRYRTSDYVKLVKKTCSCGWQGKTLVGGVLHRVDGTIKINETDFFPSDIEKAVKKIVYPHEFIITIRKKNNLDKLNLFIELPLNYDLKKFYSFEKSISETLGIWPSISVIPPHTVKQTNWKSMRFYDLRSINSRLDVDIHNNKVVIYSIVFNIVFIWKKILKRIKKI